MKTKSGVATSKRTVAGKKVPTRVPTAQRDGGVVAVARDIESGKFMVVSLPDTDLPRIYPAKFDTRAAAWDYVEKEYGVIRPDETPMSTDFSPLDRQD
jgi:hypothetical protein